MIGRVEMIGAISSGRYLGTRVVRPPEGIRPDVCRLYQKSSMMAYNFTNQIVWQKEFIADLREKRVLAHGCYLER